jgi:predicted aspartyl protease
MMLAAVANPAGIAGQETARSALVGRTKTMNRLIVVFLLVSAMVTHSFADPAPASPPACHLMQIASLGIVPESHGLAAIPAAVNGHAIQMFVDTGEITSAISSDMVGTLGLHAKQAPITMMAPGNVRSNNYVVLDKFELAPLKIPHLEMMVVPSQSLPNDVQGILGPSIMKNMDVEFDFAHAKFNLFSPDHCEHNVVYWTKDAYAEIPISVDHSFHINIAVKLDGEILHAILDSGAQHSTMGLDTARSLFDLDEKSPGMKSVNNAHVNGQRAVEIYRYTFATMSFGGVQVNNPTISILPNSSYPRYFPDILVGIDILRQLHLYISYNEKRLYVTPAGAY